VNMLQDYCYTEKVTDGRGTVEYYSRGCRGPCTPNDTVEAAPLVKTCENATKLCPGGLSVSVYLIIIICRVMSSGLVSQLLSSFRSLHAQVTMCVTLLSAARYHLKTPEKQAAITNRNA